MYRQTQGPRLYLPPDIGFGIFIALFGNMAKSVGWWRKQILIILLSALYSCPSLGESKLHENSEQLRRAKNRSLTFTHFMGPTPQIAAQSLRWTFDGARFAAEGPLHVKEKVGYSECESLLADHQYFPLNKMTSTGYINTQDVMSYVKMSMNFHRSSVKMLLANRSLSTTEAEDLFGTKWRQRLNPFSNPDAVASNDLADFVTASMWSVAGQYLDTKSGVVRVNKLPWEYDPARQDLARTFDRRKYPLVFEWGRTAQDLPSEAQPLAGLLAASNYHDTIAAGARVEDAYIMFHSFDPRNTALYNRYFPNRLFPTDWKNTSDALFLVPLKEALKRFPPRSSSNRIETLIQNSKEENGNREYLDNETAINFLIASHVVRVTPLDSAPGRPPLVLHDTSQIADLRLAYLIHRVGFSLNQSQGRALRLNLASNNYNYPTWNNGEYDDLADIALTGPVYQNKNAVEISNLDPNALETDPQYVERTLLGVLQYMLRDSSHIPGFDIQWLKSRGIKFGITTFNPTLAKRIMQLAPESHEKIEGTLKSNSSSEQWTYRGSLATQHMFFFTLDQILTMHRLGLTGQRLTQNIYARQLLLSNLQPF